MSNEVLKSALPSSLKFDELGALEIVDLQLLSTVAAGVTRKTAANAPCIGDGGCYADSWCILDGVC